MDPDNTSQLSDQKVSIDMPLRLKEPKNVPNRRERQTNDELVRIKTYSPFAYCLANSSIEKALNSTKSQLDYNDVLRESIASLNTEPPNISNDSDASYNNGIKDFNVLAFSSKRAGKKDVEALAYISLGIIYDNQCKIKNVRLLLLR